MNIWILLTLIVMAINDVFAFLGFVIGIIICYAFFDGRGDESAIKYHLTHWSWWDIKV